MHYAIEKGEKVRDSSRHLTNLLRNFFLHSILCKAVQAGGPYMNPILVGCGRTNSTVTTRLFPRRDMGNYIKYFEGDTYYYHLFNAWETICTGIIGKRQYFG